MYLKSLQPARAYNTFLNKNIMRTGKSHIVSNGCHRRSVVNFMKNPTLKLELERSKGKVGKACTTGTCFFSERVLGMPI